MRESQEEKLIAPHEGREFSLLDKGEKNVAYFCEVIPEAFENYKLY